MGEDDRPRLRTPTISRLTSWSETITFAFDDRGCHVSTQNAAASFEWPSQQSPYRRRSPPLSLRIAPETLLRRSKYANKS